jgi:hypothetical protein
MSKSDFEILRRQSKERAAEASEKTKSWKFTPGEAFEGTVVRGKVVHANDKRTPILICDEFETGDRYTIWCGNFMLERGISDLAPAVGSLVVIEFLGPQPTTSDPSRTFNNYSMAVSESDQEYWAGLEAAYHRRSSIGAEAAQHNEKPVFEGPEEAPF